MSCTHTFGKDTVIFATKEDHEGPVNIELPPGEQSPGLILPSGEINWNCPCLGGMATGPCGVEFRDAFSCFHYSEETPKGTECFETFKTMQDCFSKYPAVYDKDASSSGSPAVSEEGDLDAALAETSTSASSGQDVQSVDQLDEEEPVAIAVEEDQVDVPK